MNFITHIVKHYKEYKPITKFGIWVGIISVFGVLSGTIFFGITCYQNYATKQLIKKAIDKKEASKLPEKHIIFGVTKKYTIVPYGKIPKGIEVDWETAKIITETDKYIKFLSPRITFNFPKGSHHVYVYSNYYIMQKRIGEKVSGFATVDNFSYNYTIIGLDNDIIVIGISFFKR